MHCRQSFVDPVYVFYLEIRRCRRGGRHPDLVVWRSVRAHNNANSNHIASMISRVRQFTSGMHYIGLPSPSVEKYIKKDVKRIICTINGNHFIHSAIQKSKDGEYYVIIGAKTLSKFGLKNGDEVDIKLAEDKSTFQFEMPEELEEVLRTDSEAFEKFNGLTDGNKRGLISLVLQVKSVDKRIERSLKIADKLKCGIKSPQLIMKK